MSKFDTSTPQLKLAQQWSDAYTSLDIKNVESIISEDFQYLIFPDSTDSPQEPKEKHMERLGMMMTVLSKVETTYHEVIDAPGKVVLHATATFHTIQGDTFPYNSVTILTFVEEDGKLKVRHCKDIADSQQRNAFVAGIAKAVAQMMSAS